MKKAYSTISNAYISILYDYGDPNSWNIEDWDGVTEIFSKYIRNVKICKTGEKGCFASVRRRDLTNNIVDSLGGGSSGGSTSLVMSDGMVIGFGHQAGTPKPNCNNLKYCFHITVDVNGDKSPNRWGVDTFTFHADANKIVPRGGLDTHGRQYTCDPTKASSSTGWWNGSGCGAWVLQKENLDYLKCVKGNQDYCSQKYYFD